jgi:C-terminal processing protease CtpA/Prc
VDTALHAGTITIKDFDNENLRIVYNQEFDKVIPEFFSEVRNRHLEYLILDLRGNQGGDLKNGILLLSNLLDTTFQVVRSYESVDPTTCHIPEARLQPAKGPEAGYHEPVKKNFSGKLFVLINGGTYSASSIVCSVLQQADRCTFIGEETGGNPVVIAGEGKHIQLPNTKTDVLIPSLRYNIRSILFNSGRGITPDHLVVPSTEDILQHRDPAMELAYRLISNKVKSEK